MRILAYVQSIEGNRNGNVSERIRITATYEAESIGSSITFSAPIEDAPKYYVGQKIMISVDLVTV